MKRMKLFEKLPSAIVVIGSLTLYGPVQAAEEGQEMFNGKDLTGWTGNPKLWSVRDGAITGKTSADDPLKNNTFLIWTNSQPGDFELRCQFKIVPNNEQ